MTMGDGRPCRKCGTSEWYSSGNCVRCIKISADSHYKNNREKKIKNATKWRRGNPDKHYESNKKWKRKNPDKVKKHRRTEFENNPEKRYLYNKLRVTRKTKAGGSYTIEDWKSLVKHQDGRCLACGKKAKLTADHIVPVTKGGSSDISNIQGLCRSCNSSKGTKTIDYRKGGFLRWIQKRLL